MNALRLSGIMLGCCVLAALTSAVLAADEKAVDKDKIVGTWNLTKEGGRAAKEKVVLQFAKDGKLKFSGTEERASVKDGKKKLESRPITVEGSYRIEGNKLIMVVKEGRRQEKNTATIKTLTDKKLVLYHEERKEEVEFEKK